jgi:hypothetical protein
MLASIHPKLKIIEISLLNSTSNLKGGCCWGERRAINRKAKPGSPQGVRKI